MSKPFIIAGYSWVWICSKSSRTTSAKAFRSTTHASCFPYTMHLEMLCCWSKFKLSGDVETTSTNKVNKRFYIEISVRIKTEASTNRLIVPLPSFILGFEELKKSQ